MSFDLLDLQELVLAATGERGAEYCIADGIGERIRQVLQSVQPTAKMVDLPPLVRHFLLREASRRETSVSLRVPATREWPNECVWREHSIAAHRVGAEYLLAAREWSPAWLGEGSASSLKEAFSDHPVRSIGLCRSDPFVFQATGFKSYSCPGQREAVRAAFLMPPGQTLIVNLPTGEGKSLAGYAPALAAPSEGHLTIFVVPTVALVRDQERQFAAILRAQGTATYCLAWHGGTSAEDRMGILERIRLGSQRIIFTSPEALLSSSLLATTIEAAEKGMLQYLVIDEAHLVAQWGDEFRPSFQALSGLRNHLLRRAPPGLAVRTLLLSATFSQETVDTLASLFGPANDVQSVSAVHLRPEPIYWSVKVESFEEKREKVLEALRHLPRPFVLYVTTRADALLWSGLLRDYGMTRVARFDGDVSGRPAESGAVLSRWEANELDGVVATSAFGVGIDKADVRTIIHATVPETLDRFYQEVGRGGRDGRPSVSLLLHEARDWSLPRRMCMPKIVSDELGLERWQSMFESGTRSRDDLVSTDLQAIRRGLGGDTEYNLAWNLRTLLLLCRAGLIELDIGRQERDHLNSNSTYFAPLTRVGVRLKDYSHMQAVTWEAKVRPARQRSIEAGVRSFMLMRKMLLSGEEVSEVLAELYSVRTPSEDVRVTKVCGGCPVDRKVGQARVAYQYPVPSGIRNVTSPGVSKWNDRFPHLAPDCVFMFYEGRLIGSHLEQSALRLLEWLVADCGVQELVSCEGSSVSDRPTWNGLFRFSPSGVLLHRTFCIDGRDEPYSPLRRVTVFDRPLQDGELSAIRSVVRPLHAVLLPVDTVDKSNGGRRLVDTEMNGLLLLDAHARIGE